MIPSTWRLMPADLQLQVERRSQKSRIYFTNCTLTGKPDAFCFAGFGCFWSVAGRADSDAFVRTVPPSLFHQSHFDWYGGLMAAGVTCATSRKGL